MIAEPLDLRTVERLAGEVEAVLTELRRELAAIAPGVCVEHIGAISMPDGITKGDIDVNMRVAPERFDGLVAALSARFDPICAADMTQSSGRTRRRVGMLTGRLRTSSFAVSEIGEFSVLAAVVLGSPQHPEQEDHR